LIRRAFSSSILHARRPLPASTAGVAVEITCEKFDDPRSWGRPGSMDREARGPAEAEPRRRRSIGREQRLAAGVGSTCTAMTDPMDRVVLAAIAEPTA
jgi:hypothetical protein